MARFLLIAASSGIGQATAKILRDSPALQVGAPSAAVAPALPEVITTCPIP